MNPIAIAGGLGAAALAAWAIERKQEAPPPAAPKAAPADQVAPTLAGQVAPPVALTASPGAPAVPKLEVPKSAGSTVATVAAGIAVNSAVANLVEKAAGKGAADVTAINISAAPAVLAKKLTENVLVKVGAPPEVAKHTAITVGAAVVIGAPAIPLKAGAELVSLGIKAVAGQKAEETVRNAVSQLDPTKPGSIANKAVQPVSKLVKGIGKIF